MVAINEEILLTSSPSSRQQRHNNANDDTAADTNQSIPGVGYIVQLHQRVGVTTLANKHTTYAAAD